MIGPTSSALRSCRQAVIAIKSCILYCRLLPVVPHFSPAYSFPLFTRCHCRIPHSRFLPIANHRIYGHFAPSSVRPVDVTPPSACFSFNWISRIIRIITIIAVIKVVRRSLKIIKDKMYRVTRKRWMRPGGETSCGRNVQGANWRRGEMSCYQP